MNVMLALTGSEVPHRKSDVWVCRRDQWSMTNFAS